MIKLVIFDHDMTIVDSSFAIMAGFNYAARKIGLPEVSHELTMQYIATPLPTFCEGLLGEYRPEWVKLYREHIAEYERELIKPFPDTISTLTSLRDMGVKLAVVSNREYPAGALTNSGLAPYFDAIIGAEEPYGHLPYKPNPAMINVLLEHMNINHDTAVYVGDADLDIITAKAANVRAIGICTGNFSHKEFSILGAWKSIDTLSELIAIVNQDA